jgi:dTDP-4-amino-4,6-dideoxygalactose transaminase
MPFADRFAADLLHVGRPNAIDRAVFDRLVGGIFERRWFTNAGQLVQELEARLCEFLGVRHCIVICNGTVALQIACHALQLSGEVIVPAFTFVATAHALQWEGTRPIFAEVDPRTHNIDPTKVQELITERTSAIVGVHVWGRACDTVALEAIAERHELPVIYDAAHAFGCKHAGEMIGNFGRCEVFSFHATKFFNSFEGGAIATNDDELANKIRLMKNFGFVKLDTVVHLGTNGKMPEICAAMGLACFEKLDEIVAVNRRNHQLYEDGLAGLPGIRLLSYADQEGSNWQYIVVEVDEAEAGLSRDALVEALHAGKVRARRYFYPGCHRMEPYKTLYPDQVERLPATDALCQRVLVLPTGTAVSPEDIGYVCDLIRNAVRTCSEQRVVRVA